MSFYTLGPWRSLFKGGICRIQSDTTGHVIADIDSFNYKADARLIAAAPDLLEALEYIMVDSIDPSGSALSPKALDKINKALKKAGR